MSLQHGDLKDCVYPEISIDEYTSKTGDNSEVIVVGMYTIEEDAARDLADFVEKSSIDILDADVSPNPTEDGKYMVFLELKRAPDFFEKLDGIVGEIANLSGKLEWTATTRASDHEMSLYDDELRSAVHVEDMTPVATDDNEDATSDLEVSDDDGGEEIEMDDDVEDETTDVEEAMFLLNQNGMIAEEVDGKIKLKGMYFEVLGCDTEEWIAEAFEHIPVDFSFSHESKELTKALGLDWEVTNLKECVALKHHVSDNVIIVRV